MKSQQLSQGLVAVPFRMPVRGKEGAVALGFGALGLLFRVHGVLNPKP